MRRLGGCLATVAVMVLLASCGTDDPAGPAEGEHTFVYEPGTSTPTISSIVVRGSFNEWSGDDLAMTEQADGSWELTTELDPGTYQYKYVFNGDQWASNMCSDATWGNPANGNKVDPAVVTCADDGHGGQNGVLVID